MNITEIRTNKVNSSSVLGNGSITIDNVFFVKFLIAKGKDGNPYVSWPSKKGKDDKWYSDAGFIINEEAENPYKVKNEIESEIIKEFNKNLGIQGKDNKKNEGKTDGTDFNYGDNAGDGDKPTEEPKQEKKVPLVRFRK